VQKAAIAEEEIRLLYERTWGAGASSSFAYNFSYYYFISLYIGSVNLGQVP
jgi:hypothetical protein